MNNVANLTTIVKKALQEIVIYYENEGTLPNLCVFDNMQMLSIVMGKVGLNFTLGIEVICSGNSDFYTVATAYFGQDDYYSNEENKEDSLYIIKAAPYEKVFRQEYEVTGENLTEATIDAFYTIMNNLEEIIQLVSGEKSEDK